MLTRCWMRVTRSIMHWRNRVRRCRPNGHRLRAELHHAAAHRVHTRLVARIEEFTGVCLELLVTPRTAEMVRRAIVFEAAASRGCGIHFHSANRIDLHHSLLSSQVLTDALEKAYTHARSRVWVYPAVPI